MNNEALARAGKSIRVRPGKEGLGRGVRGFLLYVPDLLLVYSRSRGLRRPSGIGQGKSLFDRLASRISSSISLLLR